MSATESSSSSSSRHSSAASSPEIPKKDSGSPKNPPEVPKSPESPAEIPKEASQPQEKTPETPKKTPKSSQSSPEIPKKGSQSQGKAPEVPKKGSQSQEKAPEIPKKAFQSQKTPEIPKKAFQSPKKTPEIPKKAFQSPQKTPEIPKKAFQSPQKTPEIPKKAFQSQKTPEIPKKTFQSPQKSPEIPKKAPQSPRSPGTLKQDPKSSPENREKITSSPSVPCKESKVTDSPKSSERPNTSHKSPLSSPESPRDEHTAPAGESKAFPKKISDNRSFKSSLQVFLQQKHDTELQKTIEYKAKLERGEESDDDDIEREGEDKEEDKVMKERKSEGTKEDNKKKVDKSVEEEQAKSNKPTKAKEEASDVNQTKEEKAKTRKSKIEKETKEKEQDKKTKKEKTKSPEITPRKKQKEEETKKKEDTKEEPKKKATEEDTAEKEEKSKKKEEELSARKEEVKATVEEPAEEEEKKAKKKEEAVSMKKKEGLRDERTQGHLHLKKKRTFNPWKEYYFVLDGLLLTYYRSQHDYERLSSMKGSFDLTLVEEVCAKKPGLMKTHHPFCLARRNLPSIKLAAETKKEQERWMEALKTAVGPRRLSCYSSDKTLNSGTSPANYPAKSATLPGRGKDLSTYSSSITEEEEDEEKKEVKKEEEKKEEEDALLIKPKKLPRTPIGMPMFKPNLNQVKLKNVERKEVKTEDVEEGKAADASSSPSSPHESHRKEDLSREASVSGVFGVVLKKAKNKEEVEEEEVEKQEEIKESSDAGSGHEGQASPGHATSSNRRPLKQPVIPLNNKKLLVLPEVKESKSPRVSPGTQKRSTVDRKKSPSPSLPISKSVQTLTKLAEEVKATQMDATSSADTTSAEEWKGKDGEVKVCHAQTSEVTYSDVVDLLDMEEEAEELIKDRKKGNEVEVKEKDETSENECKVINEIEKQKQEKGEGAKKVLDTAVKVDENEKEDEEENKEVVVASFKEEALNENTYREESLNKYNTDSKHVMKHKDEASPAEHKSRGSEMSHSDALPESSSVAIPLTPPASPASSEASTNSEACPKAALSSTSFEVVPPSKSSPHSPKQTLPLSGDRRDVEEKMHSTTQECKQMAGEKQEESETMANYGPRDRSNTNESSTSSSGLEGAEKKPGKLKLLKNKLKSVSMKEKKEESAFQKEPEKKRRGSNTFSSLLQGKKSKEGSKKPAEELQPSQVENTNGSRVMPPDEVTPPSKSPVLPKAEPVTVMPPVDVQVIPPSASQPCKEEPQEKHDAFPSSLGSAGDGMVTLRATETYGETRSSVYSCTSTGSRDDPPPSIPEKTYMRAPSPNHDVPKNNRPVTNLNLMAGEEVCDDEDETNQRVDGYITQEQIEALLNANENRDKRKRSLSRNQPFAKPTSSNELIPKRPSYISCSSVDSDESQLPTTNFLSFERQSSSSSSIKDLSKVETSERSSSSFSESGDSHSPDVEGPADSMRRAPRATDAITTKNRVSLTSPEFTVEEESLSSPETPKLKQTRDTNIEDDNANKEQHDSSEDESEAKAECKDFFPVVGGDVQFRESAPLDLPTGNLRTSGIVGLKEYLEAQEEKEDFQDVKSCISRLGHSAAVEKLKQTASEQ